ncbi:MAG: hypothetical protein ACE5G3_04530 [Gammaproteobacteria bacterium]
MNNKALLTILSTALLAIASGSALAAKDPDQKRKASRGQAQFISAIDAAWVRVLRSGTYRAILNDPAYAAVPQGTLAAESAVNQSDCLPNPDVTPFPDPAKAKGLFRRMLNGATLKRCEVSGVTIPTDTTNFFRAGDALEDAIFAEIAAHYGIAITRVGVPIPPPFNLTAALNDGTCDYVEQVNALGGETEDLRRRDTRLFSCVISSSSQFLYVPNDASDRACVADGLCASAGQLNSIASIDDLQNPANANVRICTGNLSTQMSNQYFPNNTVSTVRFPGDMGECAERVLGGGACACPPPFIDPTCRIRPGDNPGGVCPVTAPLTFSDVMVSPVPDFDLAIFNPFQKGRLRRVDLDIVAGTPLWAGIKDVNIAECDDDDSDCGTASP